MIFIGRIIDLIISILTLIKMEKTLPYLQEKMHKFRGFYIQKRSLREYPIKSAPNVLGYISEVNEPMIEKNPYYQLGELIGNYSESNDNFNLSGDHDEKAPTGEFE